MSSVILPFRITAKTWPTFPDDRCVVRYGYKDVHKDDHDFENQLIVNLAEFIRTENEVTYIPSRSEVTTDERMAVMGNTMSTKILQAFGSTGSDFEQSSVSIQTRVSPVARFQVQATAALPSFNYKCKLVSTHGNN